MMNSFSLPFSSPYPNKITSFEILKLIKDYPTPFYLYDETTIKNKVEKLKQIPIITGTNYFPRYAIKANSNRTLLNLFQGWGIGFDASSIFEVERMVAVGINPKKIMLTTQEFNLEQIDLIKSPYFSEIYYNASSLHQLEFLGKFYSNNLNRFSQRKISIRINPGHGTGIEGKTNVAGINSGFGIWYKDIKEIKKICNYFNLTIEKLHTHIGSGADPMIWSEVAEKSLKLIDNFPKVITLNLGGGFKIARHKNEYSTDLKQVGEKIFQSFNRYYSRSNRKINLELEPGSYLIAEAGLLVAKVVDMESSVNKGISFLKLDTGMNDLIRPALYGSKHHLDLINYSKKNSKCNGLLDRKTPKSGKIKYRVIGHCCECSDDFTSGGELIELPKAEIGDVVIIHGVGAYGTALSSNYNSFPTAHEFLKREDGKIYCIRGRTTIQDLIKNEYSL